MFLPDHPVVISKFMLNSLEVDVDGISNGKEVDNWCNSRTY